MLETLSEQIARAQQRRAVALPSALGPATRFDPRLPGFHPPSVGPFQITPVSAPLPEHDEDIAFAPLAALGAWIRSGELTATRLTDIYLARIARLNPALFCFSVVTAEAARHRAAELDQMTAQGKNLGPLHGIPYGMKDIIDTAGVETSWGAEPYQGRVPAENAFITDLLHEAGAIMLGKTAVGALAYGDLWFGGRTRNPWNPQEGSSGSSAGSAAAAAAGLVGFAIGTETLGSIVSPATRCGATGLRPTYGRVSRRGAMPLCWSLDKIGPLGRTVEDNAIVLSVLNQPDPQDAFQIPMPFGYASDMPIAGLRVGYYPEDFDAADGPKLDGQALESIRALGLEPIPLTRRQLPYQLAARPAPCRSRRRLRGADAERPRRPADLAGRESLAERFPQGALSLRRGSHAARPAAPAGDDGNGFGVRPGGFGGRAKPDRADARDHQFHRPSLPLPAGGPLHHANTRPARAVALPPGRRTARRSRGARRAACAMPLGTVIRRGADARPRPGAGAPFPPSAGVRQGKATFL